MRNSNMIINDKLINENEGMNEFLDNLEEVIVSRRDISSMFLEDLIILLIISPQSSNHLLKETKN
jgi:hypothetical protein